MLNTDTNVLKQGCHSSECRKKFKFIASSADYPEFSATESGFAKLYLKLNPHLFSKHIDNKLVAFIFQASIGVYHADIGDLWLLESLQEDFKAQVDDFIEQESDTVDWNNKTEVQQFNSKKRAVDKLEVKFLMHFYYCNHCQSKVVMLCPGTKHSQQCDVFNQAKVLSRRSGN